MAMAGSAFGASLKPLDGAEDYLRWKESLLPRLHTLNVAHVLEARPAQTFGDPVASWKWERADAMCRGLILATLSDRLFPDYRHHTTARDLWRAVARTYHLDTSAYSLRDLNAFVYDDGAPLLEQLAHLEALGAGAKISDASLAKLICDHGKLPGKVVDFASSRSPDGRMTMRLLWDAARYQSDGRLP